MVKTYQSSGKPLPHLHPTNNLCALPSNICISRAGLRSASKSPLSIQVIFPVCSTFMTNGVGGGKICCQQQRTLFTWAWDPRPWEVVLRYWAGFKLQLCPVPKPNKGWLPFPAILEGSAVPACSMVAPSAFSSQQLKSTAISHAGLAARVHGASRSPPLGLSCSKSNTTTCSQKSGVQLLLTLPP